MVAGTVYKLWRSALYKSLELPVIFSPSFKSKYIPRHPVVLSDTFTLWSSLNATHEGSQSCWRGVSYAGKVMKSLYRTTQAQRVAGSWGYQISRQSAHEVGKFVAPRNRPPLTSSPANIPGTHFCYRLSRSQCHGATGRKIPMTMWGIEPVTL